MSHSAICPTACHQRLSVAPRAQISIIAGAVLAIAGCAADAEPTDTADERKVVERAPEILGELELRGGTKLTFKAERERGDNDDAPVVAITELAPRGAPSYLARIRDLRATSLEAFLALAPAGTEAPAVLREAHAREAAALGRSAELRVVSRGAATMLTPINNAICDDFVAFTTAINNSLNAALTDSDSGYHTLTFHNGGNVQAIMCNRNDAAQDYKIAKVCYEYPEGLLNCDTGTSVPDGHSVSQIWVNATLAREVRATNIASGLKTSFLAIGALPPEG